MAQPDLKKMTMRELKALRTRVEQAIASRDKRERKDALNKLKDKAKEMGYSLNDLIGGKKSEEKPAARAPAKPRKPVAPKYRHPENPDMTWSGRGRQPNWLKEAVAAGTPQDSFLIKS